MGRYVEINCKAPRCEAKVAKYSASGLCLKHLHALVYPKKFRGCRRNKKEIMRQREILELFYEGLTIKNISKRLGLREHGVSFVLRRLLPDQSFWTTRRRLSHEACLEIRLLYYKGARQTELATRFSVTRATISRVVSGRYPYAAYAPISKTFRRPPEWVDSARIMGHQKIPLREIAKILHQGYQSVVRAVGGRAYAYKPSVQRLQ